MGNPVTKGYRNKLKTGLVIDINHVEKGIKDLDKLSKYLIDKLEREALYAFADLIVDKLKKNIMLAGYPSLVNFIYVKKRRGKITIGISADYACYLEYGTGIVGSENAHPDAGLVNWQYMIGEQSSKGGGWWYPATKLYGSQPFKYTNSGELYAWTSGGLKSGQFAYKTLKWGKSQYTRYFRKFLRLAIKARR